VLGALNGTALGWCSAPGLGYVLGGVLGPQDAATPSSPHRGCATSRPTRSWPGRSGSSGGVLLGAGVAWPVFFLPQAYLAFPLFGFVVVLLGYLGFQSARASARACSSCSARAGRPPRRGASRCRG
jgi:hypothetical protein